MANLLKLLSAQVAQKQRNRVSSPNSNLKTKLRRIHANLERNHLSKNPADKLRLSATLRNLNRLINSI
jgi:hypothetical protein